ncbi:cingulin [Toxorhynchites rutilus septentrionalis]|uniref:cingulin n=1 Tax=Toxorhynchites rutilus septentrionalis TaxID=329112 RepID=UPI0024796DEC|nr:cingulin [Toxorhynchites rutilus septentrionalis]
MSDSPRSILARLEQLKQWQEEQQKVLVQKQIAQRELLNQEQMKMYAILGLGGESKAQKGSQPAEEFNSDSSECEYEETNMQRQIAQERRNVVPSKNIDDEQPSIVKRKVPTKPFLKRGEGLKTRFKVDPNAFRLENLPKYKYANHSKFRAQKGKKPDKSAPEVENKQKLQESDRNAKERRCESNVALDINKVQDKKLMVSIPDALPVSAEYVDSEEETRNTTFGEESLLPSIESLKQNHIDVRKEHNELQIQPNLPWKSQLHDDPVTLRQLKELKDLNLFELLEQRLASANGSLASEASAIMRLLAESSIREQTNSTLVPPSSGRESPQALVRPEDVPRFEIQPIPDCKRNILKDSESDLDESESSEEDKGVHVHFADEENQTDLESHLESVNQSRMSTPKVARDRRSLEAEQTDEEEAVLDEIDNEQKKIRDDILEKSELLKSRLNELETEIENFRKENAELMRMKQDHELEKMKLEQDREEMMEKMNDERIKMEVYFHDERMKIEDQRQKALKEAMKPTKKEKEEILRLKEQVSDLQKEMKSKEAKHASSMARFRSQIKNLEKDLKETQLELDVMKKDNKKLETENARLKRQNNNRMLLEINKNIAKLAAPQSDPSSDSRRSSPPERPRRAMGCTKLEPTEVVEKNKVVKVNVMKHPRASTDSRKSKLTYTSSSEDESQSEYVPNRDSDSTSNEESNSNTEIRSKSSYFRGKVKTNKTQTDTDQMKQKTRDSQASQETHRSPETAEMINSLKREVVNEDGSRDIWYPNGNLKKISPDGLVIRMLYFNKDIKETNLGEGTTKYYYFETNTWHTTYLDGLEILEFPDGQTEHRFKDGSTEVHFPNGSIRTTNSNNTDIAEEWKYVDGSTVVIKKNDDKVITLPNGQVEIHTKLHKRRIYPDGTIKFVYPDGSQESRYSNGRVRLKDKDGNLISDTGAMS